MRYVYSVIRFVPDPAREEFINVGVILGSEESSEWAVRQIENPQRARWIDERGSLPAVWGFLDRIGRSFDDYEDYLEGLAEPSLFPSEEWLAQLHEVHRNIVQVSRPRPVAAESAEEAMDRIFNELVVDPESRRFDFKKKSTALAAVRRVYAKHNLRKNERVFERVTLKAADHIERIDFAVANGEVVQLTQTWSFQIPDQEGLAEQVRAWGWTIRRLRDQGGEVRTSEERTFRVPSDTEVAVVYVAPKSSHRAPAFVEAQDVASVVEAKLVPEDQAEDLWTYLVERV